MFKNHPKGLYVLFFTEMAERFSFYSMLSLFTLYMSASIKDGGLGWSRAEAGDVYGWYLGFVYFTPFLGGIIADRWTGYRKAIMAGALFFCAGHILLAMPGMIAFYSALVCLVVGNGFFKPNISTMVGLLYPPDSPYRDAGFNIFYMGINIGALFSPFVAGTLAKYYGWHAGFGAAAVVMFISLLIFMIFKKHYIHVDKPLSQRAEEDAEDVPPELQKKRQFALILLFVILILFWMAFDQNGATLSWWADENTWWFSSTELKADQPHPAIAQSFNPFFVIVLTFLLVPFWGWLRKLGKEPSTPGKVMAGMLLGAAAFAIIAVGGLVGGDDGRVWVGWLAGTYLVITMGELCLSPMGLSIVTKLAPKKRAGLFMGLFFVSTAIGGKLSGVLSTYWEVWKHSNFFFLLVGGCIVAAIILAFFLPFLRSVMPEEHNADA